MTKNTDQELITSLQNGDESAMDVLFRRHYKSICRSVYRILKDNNLAEDIAQEVFLGLWKKRDKLKITTSVQAYLKRTAVNKSLNFIRDQKIKFDDEEKMPVQYNNQSTSQQKLEADDLQNLINDSIDLLPEKCRLVFTLSRFEEMTYQEIANELNISIKTVENQISKALKFLRKALKQNE
ncbi:RNA polymerase sigma-70 factor [Saprospiraceae bacterium]|nr:RNA polymerase sigma-70 factor [Saprospiraceae bacterium]MDG1432851.1 RNA polymerase sigma-70 factor [Saprospiraceae bacterium]